MLSLLAPVTSFAANDLGHVQKSTTLKVTASVPASCKVSSSGVLDFGTVQPGTSADVNKDAIVTVSDCYTLNSEAPLMYVKTPTVIAGRNDFTLNDTSNKKDTPTLHYGLYTDNAHKNLFSPYTGTNYNSGNFDSIKITNGGGTATIYGQLPAKENNNFTKVAGRSFEQTVTVQVVL